MAFNGAALAYEWPGAAYLMMGLVGIAGVAAIVGGALYIYITVGAAVGKRLDAGRQSSEFTPIPPTTPAPVQCKPMALPVSRRQATFTLAMVFLVSFVLYYFINWKYLSQVWGLS